MQQDSGEDDDSRCHDLLSVGRNDSAHDAGEADDRESRQRFLDIRKVTLLTEYGVQGEAQRDRQDGYDQDRFEHSKRVHMDVFACEVQHKNRRCERGEQRCHGCHAN